MIEKKTVINQIEITRSGRIQIRFAKQIVDDGNVLSSEWHRGGIDPGENVDQVIAGINESLVGMGCAPVSTDDGMLNNLIAAVETYHNKEVVDAFRAAQADSVE